MLKRVLDGSIFILQTIISLLKINQINIILLLTLNLSIIFIYSIVLKIEYNHMLQFLSMRFKTTNKNG